MKLKKISKNLLTVMISLTAVFAMVLTPINASVIKETEVKLSQLKQGDCFAAGTAIKNDLSEKVNLSYFDNNKTYIIHSCEVSEKFVVAKKILDAQQAANPNKIDIETQSGYWRVTSKISMNPETNQKQIFIAPITNNEVLVGAKDAANGAVEKNRVTNYNAENILDNIKDYAIDVMKLENVFPFDEVVFTWKEAPVIVKSTSTTDGSLKGIIVMTLGSDSLEVVVNKVIAKETPAVKTSFTSGANSTWNKGSTKSIVFKINSTTDNLVALKVDGKAIDTDHIIVDDSKGSLVITMKPAYLQGLSIGKHKLEIVYTDSLLTTNFTIKSGSPKTDDTTNLTYLMGMLGVSAVATIIIKKKREN